MGKEAFGGALWDIKLHGGAGIDRLFIPTRGLPNLGDRVSLVGVPELAAWADREDLRSGAVTDICWEYDADLGVVAPVIVCELSGREIDDIRRDIARERMPADGD